jgi:DNA primase
LAGFPQDFVEAVRAAGDIVRLVSDHVVLRPAGSRLKGLCPFHEEKTPSFSVDPGRNLFYCFGCEAGGDIFKFVMLYEKVGFTEAVESLARRWSVPLPKADRKSADSPHARLLRINAEAEQFFRSVLDDARAGAAARKYLDQRRLSPVTAKALGLGYAPSAWDALRGHLVGKRFTPEELVSAGLVLPRKSGSGEYDRFRERLIFPIRDVAGRPVAFGGRAIGDGEPKYINSPETPLYKKGEHLYGLDRAKESIRRQGQAIVVEGYLDLAAVAQAGFDNVVASLGTAFTAAQARLLARYCSRVAFSYDGDAAGAAATERSLDLLLTKGFEVRVVELPGGADPDDFIGTQGAEAYAQLLSDAPEYLEFLVRRESRRRDLSRLEEQIAAVNALLPHVARLSDPVERSAWAGRLADVLRVDEASVLQSLRSAVRERQPRIRERAPGGRGVPQVEWAEWRLVTRLMRSPEERLRFCAQLDPVDLEGMAVRPILLAIAELTARGSAVDHPSVLETLADEADRELLTWIAFRDDPEEGPTVEDCLRTLKHEERTREGHDVARRLRDGLSSSTDVNRELERAAEIFRQRQALS